MKTGDGLGAQIASAETVTAYVRWDKARFYGAACGLP